MKNAQKDLLHFSAFMIIWWALLECPQHASQACTNTCIILKAKQGSSSSPPLQSCLLKIKVNTSKNNKGGEDKSIEAKRMVKVFFFFSYFLENCPFCAHIKKKPSPPLFAPWSFLLVHIWFAPSEGSMALKTNFYEVRPWKSHHELGPLTNANFHNVNRPLVLLLFAYLWPVI